MTLSGSSILFMLFIAAYTVMIEIFTVLFRLTGLTNDKARTQVISLLTNSGFTTAESEIILASKKRRKLAQITMLSGYSFSVIIVSIIVNVIITLSKSELHHLTNNVIVLVAFVVLLFFVTRMKYIRKKLDHLIERLGNRIMFGKHSNPIILIDNYRSKAMVEVYLDHVPSALDHKKLGESDLTNKYNIQILFIKRQGKSLKRITGDTVLHPKDTLILFGNYKNIRTIFERAEQ